MKLLFLLLALLVSENYGQIQYAFTNFVGATGGPGSADGLGTAACFSDPTGIALDSAGNLYIADKSNSIIRKMTPDGLVSTLAGSSTAQGGPQRGSVDGTESAAQFWNPHAVAVDKDGNVYVADQGNHAI